MKKQILTGILLVLISQVFAREKVILDTDPSFDPDDVGCIAMLQTMASKGECDILAIINSTNQKESSLCISAINSFYNRKAIPVGDYKGYDKKINATENTYDFHIARDYPRELESWEDAHDGVKLYREILESAEDKSITVVIIGTMQNFYGLLNSGPDEFSAMSGVELVEKKVKLVSSMGGNFLNNKGLDRTNWGGSDSLCSYTEWSCLNEQRNRMCRYVIDHCPAPFMASGWENGNGDYFNAGNGNVITGQALKKLPEDHIVRRSYERHFEYRGGAEDISRHSNDQCALHYAIRGEGENYIAYTNGNITLTEKGVCSWKTDINNRQGHIQKNRDDELIAAEIEALMMGAVPDFDNSPPNPPENIRHQSFRDKIILLWDPSCDTTVGSWVVAYNVYRDGEFIQQVYGTKFSDNSGKKNQSRYEIRAVNASGTLSLPAAYSLLTEKESFLHPAEVIVLPEAGDLHSPANRKFTGIPSMAISKGGRIWAAWYAGITPKEDNNNYVVVASSDDRGESWNEKVIIDPDAEGPVRAFDPELWIDPAGKLWLFWAQAIGHDGTIAGVWTLTVDDPDAAEMAYSEPRRLTDGVMMCKPTVLSSGDWVLPASTWKLTANSARVVVSTDQGESWQLRGAVDVPEKHREFDEHMIIEKQDGSLWMLVRTRYGIGESISKDRGSTWSALRESDIKHPSARFFLRRLESGNLLLVKHGPIDKKTQRSHLMAFISKNEGKSWSKGLLIDQRLGVSYPDGQQTADGRIYIIYDYDRTGSQNICLTSFTEEDVLARDYDKRLVRVFNNRKILSKGGKK